MKTIKVGSTKLLEASEPKQTSSIKLNELWLLFLRLLMLSVLVFILAEPGTLQTENNDALNYVVEASLLNDERMRTILDTVPKESVRILKKGFPKWGDYEFNVSNQPPSYWQLAQQMDAIPADSIVIFSEGSITKLHGARPEISANTRWIVLEADSAKQQLLEVAHKESYAEVLSVSSGAKFLSFKKDTISLASDLITTNRNKDSVLLSSYNAKDWMAFTKQRPIQIGILAHDTLYRQVQYLKAAYRGIAHYLNRPVKIEILKRPNDVSDFDFDTLVSFDNELPVTLETNLLLYRPDIFSNQLIVEGPTNTIFHLTRLLDIENIVKEHLPQKLLKLLQLRTDLSDVINSNDLRSVAENELQPIKSKKESLKNNARLFELTPWLWLFFMVLVIGERVLSKSRKQ